MNTLIIIGVAAFVAIAAFAALNFGAFSKMKFWARSKAGKAGTYFEQDDPVAQMRQAAVDAGANINSAREALVKAEALKGSLERQVRSDTAEIATLTSRINKKLDSGTPKDSNEITQLAEALARAKKSLEMNQTQLADNVSFYNTTLAATKKEAAKITQLDQRAMRFQVRLDLSTAQAGLAEMANRFKPASMNGALQTASKFEEIAERKIEENSARLRVNAEFADPATKEEEETASIEASSALDEILASRPTK